MRKEPLRDTNKWLNKLFFPRLLAATAFRYVFRNSGRRIKPETAQKITHALTFGYVASACTLAGMGKLTQTYESCQIIKHCGPPTILQNGCCFDHFLFQYMLCGHDQA